MEKTESVPPVSSRRSSTKSEKSDRVKPDEKNSAVRRLTMPSPQKSKHRTDHSRMHDSSHSKREKPQAAAEQSAERDASRICKAETTSKSEVCKRDRQQSESLKADVSSHSADKPKIKTVPTSSGSKDRRKESRSHHKTVERGSDSHQAYHASVKHTASSSDGQKTYCMHSSTHTEKHESSNRRAHVPSNSDRVTAVELVHSGCTENLKKDANGVDESNDSSSGAYEAGTTSIEPADAVAAISSHGQDKPKHQTLAESEKKPDSLEQIFHPTGTNVSVLFDVQQDECIMKPDAEAHRDQDIEMASRCVLAERDNVLEKNSEVHMVPSNESAARCVASESSACMTASVLSTTAEDHHLSMHNTASNSDGSLQPDLLPEWMKSTNGFEAGGSAKEVEKPERADSCVSNVTSQESIVTELLPPVFDEDGRCSSHTARDSSLAAEASTDILANPCIRSDEDSCAKAVLELPVIADNADVVSDGREISALLNPRDGDVATDSHSAMVECILPSSPKPQLATDGQLEAEIEEDTAVRDDDSGCR